MLEFEFVAAARPINFLRVSKDFILLVYIVIVSSTIVGCL